MNILGQQIVKLFGEFKQAGAMSLGGMCFFPAICLDVVLVISAGLVWIRSSDKVFPAWGKFDLCKYLTGLMDQCGPQPKPITYQ